MKGLGLIAVLISLVIVAVLAMKQRNTAVKTVNDVKIEEVPAAVQGELDTLNQQSEKRVEEGLDQE